MSTPAETTDSPEPRTVIVTGASLGIGRAIAEAFADLGWRIAIGARNAERLGEVVDSVGARGGKAFAHALDVRDELSVETFCSAAQEALGPIDVLINNAGGAHPGRLHEISYDDIRFAIESSLIGSLFMSRCVVASMLENRVEGDVVFISSRSVGVSWPGHIPYAASKAGMESVGRALGQELEGTGIRVITARVGDTMGTGFANDWTTDEQQMSEYWAELGILRHGGVMEPPNVASAVVGAVTTPRAFQIDFLTVNAVAPTID